MADVKGTPREHHQKFRFEVSCAGLGFAGFQKAGPLSREQAVVEQHEGGSLIPSKTPGRLKYENLKLERGATTDLDLYKWCQETTDAANNAGRTKGAYKRTLDIVQKGLDDQPVMRYRVFNAWPTKFQGGDWDNTADENTMESVELAYDYFIILPV